MSVVDITDRTPNTALVGLLRRWLAEAEAGELRSVFMVGAYADASVDNAWSLDPRSHKRRMLGEIAIGQFDLSMNIVAHDSDSATARILSE